MHRTPGRDDAGTSGASATPGIPVMSPQQFKRLMDQYAEAGIARNVGLDDDEGLPSVNSTAVKLPTFWSSDPELWFFQVEAVFENRHPKVTVDGTKFNHVMAALPQEVLNACRQIIRLPPATADKYDRLKAALTDNYGKTESQRHAELIEFAANKEPILDIKPTALLMHITNLSGSSYVAMERAIFLNRLPSEVRTILSSSQAVTNTDLAKEANVVLAEFLLAKKQKASAAVSSVSSPPPDVPEVAAIYPNRQTSSQPPRSNTGVPFLCYVHARYGQQAFSCRSPKCPMRHLVKRPPTPASGNARPGRQ